MSGLAELTEKIEVHNLWSGRLHLKRKDFLIKPGAICTSLYFIESGSFHIYISGESTPITIRLGYPGEILSALDSFLSDKPTRFFIQAIKASTVRIIQKDAFLKLVNQSVENARAYQDLLEHFIVGQMDREQDLLISDPKERYLRVLERSPKLFQHIPVKYIASYLRMTPETLSRLRKS